jgi:hypothetical protein
VICEGAKAEADHRARNNNNAYPRNRLLPVDQAPGNPLHLSTVAGTNGGYSAWSKFNRHPWSKFSRRRHDDVILQR